MVVVEHVSPEAGGDAAFVVVAAGTDDANGVYAPTGKTWHGAPVFENDRRCLLSREPHKNSKTGSTSYGWILGQDRKPLYAVQAESVQPPTEGWRKFTGAFPLPQLKGCSTVVEAALWAARAWKDQGNAHFNEQRYEPAAHVWTRALHLLEAGGEGAEQRPEGSDAVVVALLSNRAEARLRQGRWEEALADAQKALERRPKHDKALLRAAVAARELKRYPLAQDLVLQCLEAHPACPEAKAFGADLDKRLGQEREAMPEACRAGRAKLQESLRRESGREGGKSALKAFAGYGDAREKRAEVEAEPPPLHELPYHHMNIPREQVEMMDKFFQEMRDKKAAKKNAEKEKKTEYESVKESFREAAETGIASGKFEPLARILPNAERARRGGGPADAAGQQGGGEEREPAGAESAAGGAVASLASRVEFTAKDAEEIDSLFAGLEPKLKAQPAEAASLSQPGRREQLARELKDERRQEAEEEKELAQHAMEELRQVIAHRGGEPDKFEQAGAEVYACWYLPASVAGPDVKVKATQGGKHLTVTAKDVVLFNRRLFLPIRGDDIVWTVDRGELHLTLTKGERSKLWEQLGAVSEIERDADGNVIPETVPEPLAAKDRIDFLKQMIEGDDGEYKNYDDLDVDTKQLVETLRRHRHAKATGDSDALALAELDLEEMGRFVV